MHADTELVRDTVFYDILQRRHVHVMVGHYDWKGQVQLDELKTRDVRASWRVLELYLLENIFRE